MTESGAVAHPEASLIRPEIEEPGLAGRTIVVGARLLGACIAFYFLGFLFAFVFLKTVDSRSLWRPKHMHGSSVVGIVVLVLVLVMAASFVWATNRLQHGRWDAWRRGSRISVLVGLAAVAVLVVQLFHPGFPYGAAAYASVFVGWFWSLALALLAMLYAITTLSAQSHRTPPEEKIDVPDLSSPAAMTPMAEATRFLVVLVAGVEIVAWVLLYLVR